MPRRTRNWLNRSCYHITHRCLNREFFFEDPITRQTYLKELCEMVSRFKVDILNYTVTCNHVHLLVYASKGTEIANGMQYLQGRMAQRYNMFSDREGAFWSGRYHATLIETGEHLSQCVFYIDYNMMRAGVVSHPSEWTHSGYHELAGDKRRNRIINFNKLLGRLGMANDKERFFEWYNSTIDAKAEANKERQPHWSEALAVGGESWIRGIRGKVGDRRMRILSNAKNEKEISYPIGLQPISQSVNERQATYVLH